jgi:hypothetical protein
MTKVDQTLTELAELMAGIDELEKNELVLDRAVPERVTVIQIAKYESIEKPLKDGSGTWVNYRIIGHDLTDTNETKYLYEGQEPQGKESGFVLLFDRYTIGKFKKWAAARFVSKAEAVKQALVSLKALKAKGESSNDVSAA